MRSAPVLTIVGTMLFFGISGCGAQTDGSGQENVQMTSNEPSNKAPQRAKRPTNNQGQAFDTLDEYLSHLKKLGAQDYPFYELVGPNKYKLNIGRGGNRQPARYFTREELAQKYGFTK